MFNRTISAAVPQVAFGATASHHSNLEECLGERLSLLLVEDSEDDAEFTQLTLADASARFHVDVADSLSAATAALATGEYDALLLDLGLPDNNGLVSLQKLKAMRPDTPMIVLTGLEDGRMSLKALEEGAQDYLIKDRITPYTLERAIYYAIGRQRLLGELKATQRLLEQKNKRLTQLYETAHRLVDNASHEFRTPLTVIMEYGSLLRDGVLGEITEQQQRFLEVIDDRADDLNTMVDDMLDVSKIRSGILGTHRKECRVEQIFEHVKPSLQQKARLKNVRIAFDIADSLPEIYCDPEKVGRILINLTVNAIKFCGENGRVEVWARQAPSGGDLLIGVTDNGPGIDKQDLEAIFARFRQLGSENHRSQGFGLGLNIAKELVDLNFGELSVESVIGVGSTFRFTLPPANPLEVARRYLVYLRRREDQYADVALLRVQINDAEEELANDFDSFLVCVLRRHDLLLRVGRTQWLMILAIDPAELTMFTQRVREALRDANRNRPHHALPEMTMKVLRSWALADADTCSNTPNGHHPCCKADGSANLLQTLRGALPSAGGGSDSPISRVNP